MQDLRANRNRAPRSTDGSAKVFSREESAPVRYYLRVGASIENIWISVFDVLESSWFGWLSVAGGFLIILFVWTYVLSNYFFEDVSELREQIAGKQVEIQSLTTKYENLLRDAEDNFHLLEEQRQTIYSLELRRDALRDEVNVFPNQLAARGRKTQELTVLLVQAKLQIARLDAQLAEVRKTMDFLQASVFEQGQRLWDDGSYFHACQVFSFLAETNPTNTEYVARKRDC